ncbi:MDR/zinc-dependent alcohol dehydrogenase-like family protein [Pseudoroseicyclus aestuarii]|uniref:Threonine dehydrogenase-like Zn-dependent dehydrogenase n=1 Tax=Pseudoroseicyclus aestuarii TaxID=1795041 RepID=A0A318T5Q2_9RHOB|nr:zinc-binding dehydrogenase [Pseudoroseicyclus aestuarii]PYE83688.1 threonine dehydrogenase-like Zn-dependent dehydrogenase [Pseudoroseicyclus aestuarii]
MPGPDATAPQGAMTAVEVTAPGAVRLIEADLPRPGPGQMRVRLEGCGVCASNLGPWSGPEWQQFPLEPGALGHEGWGIVEALGEGAEGFPVGSRVAFQGMHSFASHDIADPALTVALPEALAGQPVPAEPLGCAMNIFRRAQVRPGQTVVIIGIGFLGALLTQLCAQAGARVIAISRREESLALARRMGAAETVPMHDHWEIIEALRGLTDGRFADVVIEAVGKQWPLDLAAELTAEGGRLVIAGYHQDGPRQVNMQLWNWRGFDAVNAHERDPAVVRQGMEDAVTAWAEGRIDPAPLFTHDFAPEQLDAALDATRDKPEGFVKALIRFGGVEGEAR